MVRRRWLLNVADVLEEGTRKEGGRGWSGGGDGWGCGWVINGINGIVIDGIVVIVIIINTFTVIVTNTIILTLMLL